MVRNDDGPPTEARPPLLADLIALCRSLNREGARYVVIGGMAIIQAGFVRATEAIDLLLDGSAENVARVKRALLDLPDQAVREMAPEDVDRYTVVRVADEFVVDLLKTAGGISFPEAATLVDLVTLEGVSIPFANAELLWRTKQGPREKDRLDRQFLAARRASEEDAEDLTP